MGNLITAPSMADNEIKYKIKIKIYYFFFRPKNDCLTSAKEIDKNDFII